MEGRGTKRFLRRKGGNHGEVMCLDDSMARASEVVGGTPSSWINGVRSSTTFFDLGSLPTIQQLCENRGGSAPSWSRRTEVPIHIYVPDVAVDSLHYQGSNPKQLPHRPIGGVH